MVGIEKTREMHTQIYLLMIIPDTDLNHPLLYIGIYLLVIITDTDLNNPLLAHKFKITQGK
jgi:hypothetical protein